MDCSYIWLGWTVEGLNWRSNDNDISGLDCNLPVGDRVEEEMTKFVIVFFYLYFSEL